MNSTTLLGAILLIAGATSFGCGAQDPDDSAEETTSEAHTGASAVGATSQALQIATTPAAKRWCAARLSCYNACDRDYPSGGGPLATCKKLCDSSVASKCRAGVTAGVGAFIE